jgi:hypothetical protein
MDQFNGVLKTSKIWQISNITSNMKYLYYTNIHINISMYIHLCNMFAPFGYLLSFPFFLFLIFVFAPHGHLHLLFFIKAFFLSLQVQNNGILINEFIPFFSLNQYRILFLRDQIIETKYLIYTDFGYNCVNNFEITSFYMYLT